MIITKNLEFQDPKDLALSFPAVRPHSLPMARLKAQEPLDGVAQRMTRLRMAEAENMSAFALRLGITISRWSNIENGHPLSRDLAILLCQKIQGLSLDWIYFGKTAGLTVEMAEKLGELPGRTSKRSA